MYEKWEVRLCLGWGQPLQKAKGGLTHIQRKVLEWAREDWVKQPWHTRSAHAPASFDEAIEYLEKATDHSGGVFTLRGWG